MATALSISERSSRFAIRPDPLAASLVLLLSMTVIQRAVGFGRSLLLCRWLPAEELGHWDLTFAFFDFAAPIVVFSLPACFARYVEQYRQKGRLRLFLHRMIIAVTALILTAALLMYINRAWFSQLLYNESNNFHLINIVLLGLPAVIVFNVINELFCGLRKYRAVSILQFMQSILFATFAVGLAASWSPSAASVAIGFGLTCAVCSIIPAYWLLRMWLRLPSHLAFDTADHFWPKMLSFAGAVWASNFLTHLLLLADRYMLLHHSGLDPVSASAAVGQYHSARIIPLLIVQLASMVGTMFVPYFSHDWEAGRRDVVCARVNMFLKVTGLGLLFTAAMILLASPILFVGIFQNKFGAGQAILPWTLLWAIWFSLFCIARSYLWCDERVSLINVSLIAGLALNILTNTLLLPILGITGAAVSASLSTITLLFLVYALAFRRGLNISLGTWLITIIPLVLYFGPWATLALIAALLLLSTTTNTVFDASEKEQLAVFARDALTQWRSFPGREHSLNTSVGIEEP